MAADLQPGLQRARELLAKAMYDAGRQHGAKYLGDLAPSAEFLAVTQVLRDFATKLDAALAEAIAANPTPNTESA